MKIKFKTVLLVYRNEQKLQNFSTELIREGYFIITERTGTAALKILRRADIDLVIFSGAFQDIQPKNFLAEIQSLGYIDKTIYISREESIEEFFQFGSLGLHRYAASNISQNNLLAWTQEFFENFDSVFCCPPSGEITISSKIIFSEKNGEKLSPISLAG